MVYCIFDGVVAVMRIASAEKEEEAESEHLGAHERFSV